MHTKLLLNEQKVQNEQKNGGRRKTNLIMLKYLQCQNHTIKKEYHHEKITYTITYYDFPNRRV